MSCIYPDARSPLELWENVLAQRRAFRRLPSERLRIEDYLSPDRSAPDCTYAGEASVIEGYEFDRVAYTHDVVDVLARYEVDLIAMAGFGTILEKPVHDAYPDRIVNTHPALLPAFKGWHAVEDAFAAGVEVTGCTVHYARLDVDDGPILAQETVPVLPDDTVATLHERIKDVERRLYPAVLQTLIDQTNHEENR